jgi:hypothetical protein
MIPLRFLAFSSLLLTQTVPAKEDTPWWSLQPIAARAAVAGNVVDYYIDAKLKPEGLQPAPPADARTLVRRLYFDLTGLPPSPEEVEAFVKDFGRNAQAYTALVDRLLASPRYGERWARYWLDVVHYGDTHGYDKDQPRPNAWPYRDYVIRVFNEDKPYAQFVQEQLAGDVLFPNTLDGIEALGFIAAGPWDLIGHAEVPEDKTDGKIARHLDRDDMVANTMNTFCSLTVHCAQCHDHKFDPIPIEDYYSLQAVFAAVDRADREYDTDPTIAAQRTALKAERDAAKAKVEGLTTAAAGKSGEAMAALEKMIAAAKQPAVSLAAQNGYHSNIEQAPDKVKWVQVDLGKSVTLSQVVLHPCHDEFNGIGDGFGFPVRFKVEASDDAAFASSVTMLADETAEDFANPKLKTVSYGTGATARYVRVTATKLAPRMNDFIFALAELEVMDAAGRNLAAGVAVTALDSIEAPVRWQRTNLTDGWYPGVDEKKFASRSADVAKLEEAKRLTLEAVMGEAGAAEFKSASQRLKDAETKLKALPAPSRVYCGTIHTGSGAFTGTGAKGGAPRPIYVLSRGDVKRTGPEALPGSIAALPQLPSRFDLPAGASEGQRRAALAKWITDPQNPLTWRSIVNRVWQYHFGRGLVETPSDFGRMGALPSHPELLDWLAADFRDSGGSLKKLHRQIVLSAAYQRSSQSDAANDAKDGENKYYWRANRRKLEAEAVRDSILAVSGMLDLKMGGPAFQDFVIEHPEHSPHYQYHLADLSDSKLHRRSVYRFLVRSKPQPWMATMDCADPSILVDKRSQTITPLQALAQLNNQLTLVAAKKFAARVEQEAEGAEERIQRAMWLAVGRAASQEEVAEMKKLGLAEVCRVLLNLNEFVFVD